MPKNTNYDTPITDDVAITATIERPVQGMGTLLSKASMPSAAGTVLEPNLSLGAQKFALLTKGNQAFVNSIRPSASSMPLAVADDHSFQGDFTNTTVPGTYTVTYRIKGKHPSTGDFERIEQRAVVLRFTDFSLNASAVKITRNRGKEGFVYTWTFTPKDKYGNYLGPDYGSLLQVASPDGKIQQVKDLGNGSYEIKILTTGSGRPRLQLGLYDEDWFNGVLPAASDNKRFSLSLHTGAAIPTGNFANAYTTSVYGKLDLEYRLNNDFSLQAIGGLYNFNKGLNMGFGALQLKKYFPISSGSNLFAEAGPGLFFFPAKQYAGVDVGVGVDFKLGSKHRLSIGGNYINLFNHPLQYKWLGAGVGLHLGF